jgi:gluconolactonase
MSFIRYFFSLVFFFCLLPACNQKDSYPDLFKSTVLTPVNSSTSGIEGPAVDRNGTLYYVNYAREGTIGKLTPDGESSLFIELPQGSIGNGIRFNSHGDMLIADYTKHNILKTDMNSGKITVFAHESRMSQPNDIAIDSNDRLYASDPDWATGKGRIWRIDTDGSFTLLDSLPGAANGIDVSPDEKYLYVNASGKVYTYDLSPEGDVSNRHLLIEFAEFGMDGMRCDINGNLYISRYGKGTVVKVSPEGNILQEITLTGRKPSNICFGGKDGCTAYVTLQDKGNIESFRTDYPGREWKMQQRVNNK